MKLAVITDTSAALTEQYKSYDNLHILDIPIIIDGVTYKSGEISDQDFYDLMTSSQGVPKTSQPSIIELREILENLKMQGYSHVLGLFLTSGISGFYQNAFYLQDEFAPMQVKFPETNITSSPLGNMVETALENAQAGKSWEDILADFEQQEKEDAAYMLVDDLRWLSKSGRLSNGAAILGTLLQVKPVLTFSAEGKVEVFEKVRTARKTMARMKELLLKEADRETSRVYVIHAQAEEKAQELYDYAREQGYKEVEIVTFGPVIATHLGLGSVAYAMSPKRK
jgi:DegV family protein with EDD domain